MKHLYFIFLLSLIFVSCKKDPVPDNIPAPVSQVPVGALSNYDALFSCVKLNAKVNGSFVPTGNLVAGYFSSALINNEVYSAADLQNIGGVVLNGIVLKTKTGFAAYYYNDTTSTAFIAPYNWQILGSSVVDSFSYSNSNPPPDFPLAASIPDSLYVASGLTIHLKGTTGCDLIRVILTGGNNSTQSTLKLTAGSDSLISFSPADLQNMSATRSAYLSIQFYKDNYRLIKGKKVNFRTGTAYSNAAFIIKP